MIQPKDIKHFNRLLIISNIKLKSVKSHKGRYLISALIINKNRFVVGFNDYIKSHPYTIQNKSFLVSKHAEIDALSKWPFDLKLLHTSTMYISGLIKTSGNICISSKPCESCLKNLSKFGIKRVIYSTNIKGVFSLHELNIPESIFFQQPGDIII